MTDFDDDEEVTKEALHEAIALSRLTARVGELERVVDELRTLIARTVQPCG